MQNIIIILIVALCAFFVGRRFYGNFRSRKGTGCGCSCSGCGPDMASICHPDKKSDTQH